jgi:hypothetical protein
LLKLITEFNISIDILSIQNIDIDSKDSTNVQAAFTFDEKYNLRFVGIKVNNETILLNNLSINNKDLCYENFVLDELAEDFVDFIKKNY